MRFKIFQGVTDSTSHITTNPLQVEKQSHYLIHTTIYIKY